MRYIPQAHDSMFRYALERHPGAAQARWPHLEPAERAAANTEQSLARTVARRYGIRLPVAAREVHVWIVEQSSARPVRLPSGAGP